MDTEKFIKNYKGIILNLISSIEEENYDKVDELIRGKAEILKLLEKNDFSKNQLKEFFYMYKINELEDEMYKLIMLKKENIKIEMKKKQTKNRASECYNQIGSKAVFLSREI